ncbi:hypothetical protein [Pseudomonas sp. Marseille-QA0892]
MSFAECMSDLDATNVNAADLPRNTVRFIDILKAFARMLAPRARFDRRLNNGSTLS